MHNFNYKSGPLLTDEQKMAFDMHRSGEMRHRKGFMHRPDQAE